MQTKKLKNSINYGDAYGLGDHILFCADATDAYAMEYFLENQKINAIITDPPYGINYVASKASFGQKLAQPIDIANDQEQTDQQYARFTEKWLKNVLPFLTKKNAIYIFNSDKMIFALREAMLKTDCKFSQLLVWVKNASIPGRLDYQPAHELIAYGWHGTHEFKKAKDKSVLYCAKPTKSKLHPTMKPLSLLRRLILNSTNIGDTIYDPFGGSGSLLIAAEQTKRKCIMVEIDPQYCKTIIDRFEKTTSNKVIRLTVDIKDFLCDLKKLDRKDKKNERDRTATRKK